MSFMTKENFYHGMFLLLIFIVLTTHPSITFAVLASSVIASLSSNFVERTRQKIKLPKWIFAMFFVSIISVSLYYLFKTIIVLIIVQSSKLLVLINDTAFIDSQIDKLHVFVNKISDSLLSLKERAENIPYGLKKIDNFIDELPDLVIYKTIAIIKPYIEKSYVPGLKLLNLTYTLVLFLVFLFYFVNDWDKIRDFIRYGFGSQNEKIQNIVFFIKNIVIKIFISQIKVALILTVLYSAVLFSIKFEYFLIYAICFSFFTLIPVFGYLASFTILSISCFIFGYPLDYSLKLLGILGCGMLVENLILTPKFVGSSINSHPLVILICLLILPNFFGILGVVFVLPFVAILSKIVLYMKNELDKNQKLINEKI